MQPRPPLYFMITSVFLALYFFFAAAVQYNDPDPIHWMVLYMTSAICCILAALGRDKLPLLYMLCGMALIEMAITGDGFWAWLRIGKENLITAKMTNDRPYIELGREFLGALISLGIASWQIARARGRNT